MNKKSAGSITKCNIIFSHLLWGLSLLTGICNLLGLWALWHLVGFSCLFCIGVTMFINLLTLIYSFITKEKEYIVKNIIYLAISVISILLFEFVFTSWNALHFFN